MLPPRALWLLLWWRGRERLHNNTDGFDYARSTPTERWAFGQFAFCLIVRGEHRVREKEEKEEKTRRCERKIVNSVTFPLDDVDSIWDDLEHRAHTHTHQAYELLVSIVKACLAQSIWTSARVKRICLAEGERSDLINTNTKEKDYIGERMFSLGRVSLWIECTLWHKSTWRCVCAVLCCASFGAKLSLSKKSEREWA